ncbi:delta-60 repeat domain-containing protein [Corallococcus macrosporus DSM 14697]|uniref:Delta-60 repeat domain-containing protein n=1 Tax=Corallococcus macrosporus DSM 14697 TaxID=1189310 RepID=A0A250K2W3_9BACT|nr:delta-60 repeat domain-containing protein [Corallococcus macrosporus DSM 14697]
MTVTESMHSRRSGPSDERGPHSPRVKPLLALMLLCLAPIATGCDPDPAPIPIPSPDAGTQRPDSGTPTNDAGTDAGTEAPDAGEPTPGFTLQAPAEMTLRFIPERRVALGIIIVREPSFTDDVSFAIEGLPSHVHATSALIPGTESAAELSLTVEEFARYGTVPVTLVASSGATRVEHPMNLVIEPGPAALDASFGADGVAMPAFGHPAVRIHAVAAQPNGGWVLVGATGSTGLRDVLVARLLADGTLDPDFGSQGTVTLDVCGGDDYVDAVTVLSDGRILVAGGAISGPSGCSGPQAQSLLFARFTSAGILDFDFGDMGVSTFQLSAVNGTTSTANAALHAITVDSQGRVIGAGTVRHDDLDFVIMRLTPTGAADTTFSSDGLAWEDLGEDEDGLVVITQADDRIVVAGTSNASRNGMAVRRYNVNGTPDSSFTYRGFEDWPRITPRTLHRLAGDKVLVGGTAQWNAGTQGPLTGAVTRLHASGSLDTAFGEDGISFNHWSGSPIALERLVGMGPLHGGELALAVAITLDDRTDGIGLIHLSGDGKTVLRTHRTNLPGTEAALTAGLAADGSMCVTGLRADDGSTDTAPFAVRFWPY